MDISSAEPNISWAFLSVTGDLLLKCNVPVGDSCPVEVGALSAR